MKTSKPKNSANSATEKSQRPKIETRNRTEAARKRLGADPGLVARCRKITPLLKECGLSRERVVEILESDDESDSVDFVAKYRSVSKSDLSHVSLEEITIAAGLTTRRLWELIQGTRLEQSQDAMKMLVADNRAAIMSKVVSAAKEGDQKATEMLWKADGTLPKSNGISFIMSQNNTMPELTSAPTAVVEDESLPLADMDTMLKEMQRVTATPQLEAPRPSVSVPIIEAEYEEVL